MITFDDLELLGNLVFDDLDEPSADGTLQSTDVSLSLTPNSTSEHVGAYDQDLDVDLILESTGSQEYVSTAAPVAYSQSANALIIWIAGGNQEHIAVAAGEFGQIANVVLTFPHASTQSYLDADISIGDVLLDLSEFSAFQELVVLDGTLHEQIATLVWTFYGVSLHDYEDQFYGPSDIAFADSVSGIVDGDTEFYINLVPSLTFLPEAIYIYFTSSATSWLVDSGLSGFPVGVEISLGSLPLASVVPSKNYIVIQPHMSVYSSVRSALASGETVFKARAYERIPSMSPNQPLNAQSSLRVRAYQ